jgi:spore coat polysaccharide biosynthesis predicted glycosyltransferase SpsG
MRFVFRADASPSKGVGHVMRLMPLVQELIRRGHLVSFVGEIDLVPWLKELMYSVGFSDVFSDSNLFRSSSEEDVLILDSYEIKVNEKFVKKDNWKFVVVLADEFTPHYEADLVFHPGIGGSWIKTWDKPVLHGLSFALIRESLTNLKYIGSNSQMPIIIILPGGTDAFRITELLVENLTKLKFDFQCFVPNKDGSSSNDSRFVSFQLGNEMEELLAQCTGAIATASTTSLELIALKIPVAILSLTKNQNDYYDSLILEELAAPLGKFNDSSTFPLNFDKLQSFVQSNLANFALAQANTSVIDGKGSSRIAEEILKRISITERTHH